MARKCGSRQVTQQRVQCIVDMIRAGMKVTAVAHYYCMPKSTVSNILRRQKLGPGEVASKKRGRKTKFTARSFRLLVHYVQKLRFYPLHVILSQFRLYTGVSVSISTARRYLRKLKFGSYVAVQKLFISSKNIVARMEFANRHIS